MEIGVVSRCACYCKESGIVVALVADEFALLFDLVNGGYFMYSIVWY
jgi:hypothetical protein